MELENIKTKVSFYLKGASKPFSTTEDYETLKRYLFIIDEVSDYETSVKEIIVDDELYKIIDIKLSIYKETVEANPRYGIDLALESPPMPYNFKVMIYVEKE